MGVYSLFTKQIRCNQFISKLRENPRYNHTIVWIISESKLEGKSDGYQVSSEWGNFYSIKEVSTGFLLNDTKSSFIYLPFDKFDPDTDFDFVRSVLKLPRPSHEMSY